MATLRVAQHDKVMARPNNTGDVDIHPGAPLVTHVTTVAMTLLFLRGQSRFMRQRGFDVQAISTGGELQAAFATDERIRTFDVPMPRRIAPLADLRALRQLYRVMRQTAPTVVHGHTPKGGLLSMIAATFARVPVRIYHMHGLPLATARGLRRVALWASEWVACRLAHRVLCVSATLREAARHHRLCAADRMQVIAHGSIGGVDAKGRFDPDACSPSHVAALRSRMGIAAHAVVIGFVGRLVPDKGLRELADAWQLIRDEIPDAELLLVGPDDETPLPPSVRASLAADPRVHLAGEQWDTPAYFAAMDIVCLPSYREGFPVVCLEAAAMGRPVVATTVTGCVDAVVDGVTGTLVPPTDSQALAMALRAYALNPTLRAAHGAAGRARALSEFDPREIWAGIAEVYSSLLASRALRSTFYRRHGKRALDVVLATIGLVIASPVLIVTALVLWVTEGRILFRQTRPGYHGRPFTIRKFQTMRDRLDAEGHSLPDAVRLTRIGRFLRSTSLDELPELWNVLRGDMSLVGPRPLLTQYLDRYSPAQARRHDVRPGITGLAQVSGRNALTWPEKFALDVEYVDTISLGQDLAILARTARAVLTRRDGNQPGHATAQEFMGNPSA